MKFFRTIKLEYLKTLTWTAVITLFLSTSTCVFAQTDSTALKVGYLGSAPFIMENDSPEGIVIDLWNEIAFGMRREFSLIAFHAVDDGIDSIRNHKIDVLIGPITINSARAEIVSFSQPFYNTELAILAPVLETTLWDRLHPFFSRTFFFAVIGLLVILTLVGLLFWLVEGRHFPDNYGKGIIRGMGSGIWLAIVTMTTVGYGDYAPKSAGGRIIMGTWMVISLILATSFVAGIATTFAQSTQEDKTIINLNQLQDKRVAVPNYAYISNKVRDLGGKPVTVDDVSEGYSLLRNEKVDVLIYDEIPLKYVWKEDNRFVLSKKRIDPQYYGFVLPHDSELKNDIDLQIIYLNESQIILDIVERWVNE